MSFYNLINPKTFAVIGASRNPRSESYRFIEALIKNEYDGQIFPINPKIEKLQGLKVFSSIEDINVPIDYVLIAVPAKYVPEQVRKCVKKNIKFIAIFSSGFSEAGNFQLEEEILEAIKGSKTRVLGPNCIGVFSSESKITYFSDQLIKRQGNISFISQSGGLTRTLIWTGFTRNFDFRAAISVGNQIDISIDELVDYFLEDKGTDMITAYIEGVKNGKKFYEVLKKNNGKKPIIILKCGRTKSGIRAISSHTGSIATPNHLFEAALKQTNTILVHTFEELSDTIQMMNLLKNNLPKTNKVAIINTGGGLSVELTDTCESNGLDVVKLTEETMKKMSNVLPPVNTILSNPLDIGAYGFDPDTFGKVLKVTSEDPNVETIITVREVERFAKLNEVYKTDDIGGIYVDQMKTNNVTKKPLIAIVPRSWETKLNFLKYQNFRECLHKNKIPCFASAERAIKALKKLIEYNNRQINN